MVSRAFISLALMLFAACELEKLDVTGLRCTSTRLCGVGFVCVSEHCVAEGTGDDAGQDAGQDAGHDAGDDAGQGVLDSGFDSGKNLLQNPSFEQFDKFDGGVAGWKATAGRLSSNPNDRHNGVRSARLESSTLNPQPVALIPETDVEGSQLGMVFCAAVWAKTDNDAGIEVSLTIFDRFPDGGTWPNNGTRLLVRREWVQLKEELASLGSSSIRMRVATTMPSIPGRTLVIDDATLFYWTGSRCP